MQLFFCILFLQVCVWVGICVSVKVSVCIGDCVCGTIAEFVHNVHCDK